MPAPTRFVTHRSRPGAQRPLFLFAPTYAVLHIRMNPSTIIGVLTSTALLAVLLAFATPDPRMFINLPGLAIVLGGTLAAIFISYPLREVLRIFALVHTVFRRESYNDDGNIEQIVRIAKIWQQGDIHAIERELNDIRSPFLRTGVQLVIDHTPNDQLLDLMQWRIARLKAQELAEAQLFRALAGFAPAFGMLGTLVGLISLLQVMQSGDAALIGPNMAVALITTLYGILLANLVCKPIALKLERRTERRVVAMNLILQGVIMLSEKRGPAQIRETLQTFTLRFDDEIRGRGASPANNGNTTPRDHASTPR